MRLTVEALSVADIERVHETTLDVLADLGVAIKSSSALELMRARGIKVENGRAHLSAKDVESALASTPSEFTIRSRNPERTLTIGPGHPPALLSCSGVPIILAEDGRQRQVTFDDYKDMLRLTHTSPVINMANSGALYPTWPDAERALYLQLWHTLTMTDKPLVGQSEGPELSKASVDMARAATGVSGQPVITAICNSLSPLAWDERMLEGIRVFAEEGQPINVSCCSMSGATAPVQLFGAIVQANAEVLAGLVYAQLVSPGTPVIYGTTSSIMDMGAMGLALGAPEYTLISAGCAQMAARYKLPYRGGGGLTDAKVIDGQAGAESTWNLLFSLSEGVHFMLQSVGVLESFMSASFDKWIADEEVIMKHNRLSRGLGPWPEDLMATFAEGVESSGYLKLKSTLKKFRTEFYRPVVGDRRSFEAWSGHDRHGFGHDCWDRVHKRLESYQPPELPKEATSELKAILARAGVDPGSKP